MKALMRICFSDFFDVRKTDLNKYGSFNSKIPKYQGLHDRIIEYLRFLKDKSASGQDLDAALLDAWYMFPEVEQNWLGFSVKGNRGHGLGKKFAGALHTNLGKIFGSFGTENVTRGSHLEKLCLIREGVGRDNISDFTNNLIHEYLLQYTQTPAVVAQFYTNNMAVYREPDRVSVNYLAYDLTNYFAAAEQKIGKTNLTSQAEAYFAQHGLEAVPGAKTPEEAKAKIRDVI